MHAGASLGRHRRDAANLTGAFQKPERITKGSVLGKFALVASTCIVVCATLASAQQIDIAVGIGTLMSASPASAGLNFQPPAEKSGSYVNVSGDLVGLKKRLGLNIETAWRSRQANYEGYETYRPILTDVNALFQPRLGKKVALDLFGGVGVASTRFNLPASCNIPGCINYTSSYHLMEDLGGGIRYYVWHRVFVRPEIHYYHIQNNFEFNSNNVVRVGASIGFTIGPD
jgi:hypothetical protein